MINAIELSNIVHCKGGTMILSLCEFSIAKNSKLALVGPNGSGKSSILEILALIDKPSKGKIFIEEEEVLSSNVLKFRRQIGFLPQKPAMLKMSVYKNIALPLKFRKINVSEMHQSIEFWMDKLNISHLSQKTGLNLSGGEQQKVALARMMVTEPKILLFDEPLTGIDRPTRTKFIAELSEIISQPDRTVIYVTHNIKEARAISAEFQVTDIRNLQGPVIN